VLPVWVGADTPAGVLTVALSRPEGEWRDLGVVWEAREREHWIVDTCLDGRNPDDAYSQAVSLEPGRHALLEVPEFRGEVRHPDGTVEKLMTYAFWLRRLERAAPTRKRQRRIRSPAERFAAEPPGRQEAAFLEGSTR